MIAPWVERIRALAGEVILGVTVTHLERTAAGWRVHWRPTAAGSGPGGTLDSEQVVLATSAPATAALLAGSPSTAQASHLLRWPQGLATATIRLWYRRQPRRGAEAGLLGGEFIIDNFFWLDRIQPVFQAWRAATGGSAVEVQIYGPPELLDLPPAELCSRAAADVERAYPELAGHRVHGVAWRNAATHTLFTVYSPAQHLGVTTPWPGLSACGDWVRHPAPVLFLERATVTALAAANTVLAAVGRDPWPILPPDPPEPLARLVEWSIRRVRRAVRSVAGTG
jgi:isorenieratene synthase